MTESREVTTRKFFDECEYKNTNEKRCKEMVEFRIGLGGYFVGTCPNGHVNAKKA